MLFRLIGIIWLICIFGLYGAGAFSSIWWALGLAVGVPLVSAAAILICVSRAFARLERQG